jgi:hypothetical protein
MGEWQRFAKVALTPKALPAPNNYDIGFIIRIGKQIQ